MFQSHHVGDNTWRIWYAHQLCQTPLPVLMAFLYQITKQILRQAGVLLLGVNSHDGVWQKRQMR